MIGYVFGIIIIVYVLYTVVPNYVVRNLKTEVPHKLDNDRTIALTFDDGPDERYTGAVLDILEEHDVKATFFVVATRVLSAPHIVQRMVREGHEVGLHSYAHRSAWLTGPYATLKEFEKAVAVIENYTPKIKWFRPPWGTFNLFTKQGAGRKGLNTVLWSVEAYDWRGSNDAKSISDEVLRRTGAGDIIVLHDAGGAEGAPANTIEALKIIIPELKSKYSFVTLEEGLTC